MRYLSNLLIIPIFLISLDIQSKDFDINTYEIEVLIFATSSEITKEAFQEITELNLEGEKVINLIEPPKTINLSAMSNSFKHEYKYEDIFKNIDVFTSNNPKDTFSKNTGYWFREIKDPSSLNSLKRRMLRRKDYELLGHYSWHQGMLAEEESPFIHIVDEDGKFGLLVKAYESRYLHLDLKAYIGQINIETNASPKEITAISNKKLIANTISENDKKINVKIGESQSLIRLYEDNTQTIAKEKAEDLITFYIDQDTRIFANEIYYFDHPKFGVVISIKDKP